MRRRVSPKIAAIVVLAALVAVEAVYWRGLLHKPKGAGGGMGGGGAPMAIAPSGLPELRVTTIAGSRTGGWQDATGDRAEFDGPAGIAIAPDGSVLVADSRNHRIRRVGRDGSVRTIAGAGPTGTIVGGYRDGPAGSARFWNPCGLAVDPAGNVYIADTGNHRIRVLSPGGSVRTLAGAETKADARGFPSGGHRDGPAATAQFRYPTGLGLAPGGTLYVADSGNGCLRAVSAGGVVTTIALPDGAEGSRPCPGDVAVAPDGALYVTEMTSGAVLRVVLGAPAEWLQLSVGPLPAQAIWPLAPEAPPPMEPWMHRRPPREGRRTVWRSREGTPRRGDQEHRPSLQEAAPIRWDWMKLHAPAGIVADRFGGLCLADVGSHCILRVTPDRHLSLLAGTLSNHPLGEYTDGAGDEAHFAGPSDLAIDASGRIYVSDFGNDCIRCISP
jgi:DNA-binding beta-propeller fold protein YncE